VNEAGYDYCAAFFAALAAAGVQRIVVSPGSRSTPLTLAAHAVTELELTVHHDERSAGFFALGLARASGNPVALICTSGTATANYLPAVIEAFHAAVPLLVLTSDRPPVPRDRGAPQTIDQVGIYGTHTRWAVELPIPDEAHPDHARATARRAVAAALGRPAGPVHLNWPLRKPLEPAAPLVPVTAGSARLERPEPAAQEGHSQRLADLMGAERGLIVAGPTDLTPQEAGNVARFAAVTGWPILADATSQLRAGEHVADAPLITTAHHLLGCESLATATPDVVLLIGGVPSSAAFERWLPDSGSAHTVLIDPDGLWRDPTAAATERIQADPARLLSRAAAGAGTARSGGWTELWTGADEVASAIIDSALEGPALSEASLARTLGRSLAPGTILYVSSSMPVRDVDLFLPARRTPLHILANRGANGIDGVTSSALGAAAAGAGPVVLLTGDLAFLHDVSGLLVGATLGQDLTLVVPNNDGGGIFSFLPIASTLPQDDFRTLFHTPHGIDLSRVAAAAGAEHRIATTVAELPGALAECASGGGLQVIEVPIETEAGVQQRRDIEERVRLAVEATMG
jgi:2-succinyl-5-enolpyruvyl-6-hydroxy-3-cyclohexene-1-carboxylate synthase